MANTVPVGGYDCEFVDPPQSAFQVDCGLCLSKLRDPQQVTCCGKSFCDLCIKRIVELGKRCPACNYSPFTPSTIFPNKGLKQSLMQLHVYCTHHRGDGCGCEWTGELGQLDQHLNEKFTPGNEGDGCAFVKIKCIHCNKEFQRQSHPFESCPKQQVECKHRSNGCKWEGEQGELEKHLNLNPNLQDRLCGCEFVELECRQCGESLQRTLISEHENEQCGKRPFSCDYCKQYKSSTFEDVSTNHWPKCNYYPVPCPNSCEITQIQRQNLEHHVSEECPLTTVNCNFCYAGCDVQLHRKDMPSHLAESVGSHLGLLGTQNQKLQQEAADKDARLLQLARELQDVRNRLDEDTRAQNQRPKENVDQISTTQTSAVWGLIALIVVLLAVLIAVIVSFQGQYRLIASNITSVQGQLELNITSLQGQFESNITSLQEQYHHIESNITSLQGQFESNFTSLQGQFKSKFTSLRGQFKSNFTSLRGQFKSNFTSLRGQFESDITSLQGQLLLPPYTTIMRDFQQHKDNHDWWFSPPFYTHPQGYKMCLKVDANGYGKGKGTHVSVFAFLMRGEFDDHLKWPFRGRVTVAMLNQLEDNSHTTDTIRFTDTTDNEIIGRVMEGEIAPIGLGYSTFIAHTELNYNPTKNYQYLMYDCLRFRIDKVELK